MINDINSLPDKRAATIAGADLNRADRYLADIQDAAFRLMEQDAGESVYLTHYASGATCWRQHNDTVIVKKGA